MANDFLLNAHKPDRSVVQDIIADQAERPPAQRRWCGSLLAFLAAGRTLAAAGARTSATH